MRERRRIAFKRHRVSFLALLLIVSLSAAAFSSGLFVQPKNVEADASTVIFLTSGTSWTVPADWNNSNNSIEVIGGGGGGGGAGGVCCTASDWYAGTGGGGSAYSKATNVTLTPNGSVGYQIGSQGVGGTGNVNGSAGGDTYFCNSTSNCTSISGTAVVAGAKGGLGGVSTRISAFASGGAGGSAASGLGSVKFSGGKGGDGVITPYYHFSGSGAGGAGGPHGNGAAGHDANNGPGTGGGGADGGSAGESGCYSCDYEPFAYGGAGGNNRLGSGYSDSNPWMLYAFPASDNHFCMGRNGVNQPFCMTDFNAVYSINLYAPAFLYSSDVRLKEHVEPLESGLADVMKLSSVSFVWKSGPQKGQEDVGFLAQDVEQVIPEVVHTDDKGMKAIDYPKLLPVLVEAIQEQQAELTEIKVLVEDERRQIESLHARLTAVEAQ